jgi:hypothetical protein
MWLTALPFSYPDESLYVAQALLFSLSFEGPVWGVRTTEADDRFDTAKRLRLV